jgi:hypothetical protein
MKPTGLPLFPFISLPGYILIVNDVEEQQVKSSGSFGQQDVGCRQIFPQANAAPF